MSKFNLTGHISEKDGKYFAKIVLKTPDGHTTTMEAPEPFETEQSATDAMQAQLDHVLKVFKEDGVEILSKRALRTV